MQSVLHVWQVKAETEANLNLGTLGNLRWLFFLAWCLFDEFLNDVEITHGDIHGDIKSLNSSFSFTFSHLSDFRALTCEQASLYFCGGKDISSEICSYFFKASYDPAGVVLG